MQLSEKSAAIGMAANVGSLSASGRPEGCRDLG